MTHDTCYLLLLLHALPSHMCYFARSLAMQFEQNANTISSSSRRLRNPKNTDPTSVASVRLHSVYFSPSLKAAAQRHKYENNDATQTLTLQLRVMTQ